MSAFQYERVYEPEVILDPDDTRFAKYALPETKAALQRLDVARVNSMRLQTTEAKEEFESARRDYSDALAKEAENQRNLGLI